MRPPPLCRVLLLLLLLPAAAAGWVSPAGAAGRRMAPLLMTRWGQRWAFGEDAPLALRPSDEGLHERLGCLSTALAQIAYFHRRCPSGTVSFDRPRAPPLESMLS